MAAPPSPFALEPRRLAVACGATALVVGLLVLAAWAVGNESVKSLQPGWPTMKANTALGFASLGLGLVLATQGRRRASRAWATVAIALGALTMLEYVTGQSLGIDELLVRDAATDPADDFPGRMAVLTAGAFVLLGLALATWDRPTRIANFGLLVPGFFALYNLVFYFFGTVPRLEEARMAIHTALLLLLLSGGLLLGRPGELAQVFLGRSRTSVDARRLMVAVVLLPLLFGWLARRMYDAGYLNVTQRASFALFANLTVLAALVTAVLLRLRREEARRAAVEDALTRSLQRIDDAERVTGRGSWEWNVTDDRAAWSGGMYRLFGVDPRTFENSNENFLAMVHPDDRERLGKAMADAMANPGRFHQEYRLRRPDGTTIHVRGEGHVVTDPGGSPTVLYGVVQDVTHVRELEIARSRAQERFARIFEASPVAIGLTKEDGRIVDANAAFMQLTGYSHEDLTAPGFRVESIYEDPADRDRVLAALRTAGLVRGAQVAIRRKDGQARMTLVSLEFVDLGGSTTILSLFQDITERQQEQADRERRIATEAELERLRRTDQFRTEFINSTAHELRTPMTSLLMSLGALQHRLAADEASMRSVATLQRAADRLGRVVADMVAAADLQARAIAIDRHRLDLARQVKAAVAGHQASAQRANLELEDLPDPRLFVMADEQRLQLALGHLLGNAIKFTPAGGKVTIRTRRQDDMARVEVADTGVGLTKAQVERLWRPFSQEHDKAQRTDSGSGLGLYLTAGVIALHGGEVGCSSPGPGKGSTFWFTLPLAPGS